MCHGCGEQRIFGFQLAGLEVGENGRVIGSQQHIVGFDITMQNGRLQNTARADMNKVKA